MKFISRMPVWFDEVRHDPYSCYWSLLIVFGSRMAERHRFLTNQMMNGRWSRRFGLCIGHLLWVMKGIIR